MGDISKNFKQVNMVQYEAMVRNMRNSVLVATAINNSNALANIPCKKEVKKDDNYKRMGR